MFKLVASLPTALLLRISSNTATNTPSFAHRSSSPVHCSLDLEGNALTLEALDGMEHLHVFELRLRNNRGVVGSASTDAGEEMAYRVRALTKLPRAWTLDGHYVSERERVASGATKLPAPQIQDPPEGSDPPPPGSPAHAFLTNVAPRAPVRNQDAVDDFRLKLLLAHYDGSVARHNRVVREQVHKPRLSRKPLSHVAALCSLGYRERLDLAVLLCAGVEYEVPVPVLQGAVSVMLASKVGADVVRDVAALPPFACTAIVRALRGLALEEVDPASGDKRLVAMGNLYSVADRELLRSVPKVAVKHRVVGGEKERYDGGDGVRCRHAVLLLQRR